MHFSTTFPLCLSLFVYTTAASPVDFSPEISIREVSANLSTREASFLDFQTREAGLSAPQTLQDADGSVALGARSLFHRHKPVRCMGGSGHFCEKNCACTKGGSVSCEKLSKAEIKKFKKTATDDEKLLEEHAQQITDTCAGVCSCGGGKVPGTKVRKIGFQIGYGDLKAAAYHVTEKDTRVHAPVAPVAPYGAPPSAPPAPPSFHSNGPAMDPYNSGVESYTPSIQRRGNAASDIKDSHDAGDPLYSKGQTPPSCKGSRPVCQGHCYCTSTGELTCDRLTKSQRKTFGSGPAVPDAIQEHPLNIKTACEPWCECKGKGKDWVEGKTLTEFNYGVGRNGGSENAKSISTADPTGLAGAGGGERAPKTASDSLSVDRGHFRGAGLPSTPAASRDESAYDISSTASHSLSLQRRGGRLSKDNLSSPQAVSYSALHSGPDHLASFHAEPIKCKSTWGKKCEIYCYCTTQGTVSCDRLPATEVERLESRPDSESVKLERAAGLLKNCKPVCGCKDRDGVYKIEGRTSEEWNVMIRQGYQNTPAPAAPASSPIGARGGGTSRAANVSPRDGISAGGSRASSSPLSATDNLPVFSSPSLDRPFLHPRGVASADKEISPSSLEPSGRGSRSDTVVCSNKNGQRSSCKVRCHCTATGTVMCGKRTDWGTTAAVAQPGTDGCLNDCWCSPGEEKARGGWGTRNLPGGGRGLIKGSDTPEFPSNRPDYTLRTPEPQAIMPLRPLPHRVPSSLDRQFPTFNQHSNQVLHPRSGSSEVLRERSGIGSKLREKMAPGQRLICHDAVKEFCLTRYTCDATGMILERGQKSNFKGMCGGFPCVHTPKTTEHYTIETCKNACTCMRTKGRGELRQIGNTGELWGGFRTPAVRGPRRGVRPIHERGEASAVAAAPSLSASQTVGQSKALHPRGGVGEAIKKKLGPGDRRLICEGAPKQFCQARYSCSKTGTMTKKCTNPVHCVSLSTQDHSLHECKAACLCFDFKNRKALREIGSTGEQWGGHRGEAPLQTSGRPEASGPEVGGPEAMRLTSVSSTPASQAALQRRRTLDGSILKARGDSTIQHPAHGARSPIATPPRLDKPPLDKNILQALGYPYVVRSPRSHTASSSNLSKPPLDKNIAKALGYDPMRYGVRGPRRPIATSASFTKPLLFGKTMKAGGKKPEQSALPSSKIAIAPSPASVGKPPLDGEGIEDTSAPQRRNVQRRGGIFSAGKAPASPDQRVPDEPILCSGAKAEPCKKKCACSAEGTVVCGNAFGPGISPWVRGALLTTGENAKKKMTEQDAQLTAECATACSCKVNGVFRLNSRRMEKSKLENAEEKSAGHGRIRVDRSPKKPFRFPDSSPKASSIVPSEPSLQRRGGSHTGDTAMSSAPGLGQHTLKHPVRCEGNTKRFCEDRCYCTPDGTVQCDSKETVEDLFVHNVHDNSRLYQLSLRQSRAKKAQYITEVTGKCTPTCKCPGNHGYKEPEKGLRKALSVIPSQTPSIQPRSGTDLVHAVNSSTPAADFKPRSGTNLVKPRTTSPASSGSPLRRPPIVCRGPRQNQCEESCYCNLRGIVKCNKVSTADDMHAVLNDPKYPHLGKLRMVQKTNLLTYHVAQRTTECVPSCSCDGGKEFGEHGELGWQFDATQHLARPGMWRSRSGSEGGKNVKDFSSVQERSISIFSRDESQVGSHQSSPKTANTISSSADHSQPPKLLLPRGRDAPTIRQAYPLPRTQHQQQPQYRHIPQLLRPPQKRSVQSQRRSALPPAEQPPHSQPQEPHPPQPESIDLLRFKPSPEGSSMQRAPHPRPPPQRPQPQSPRQTLFRPVARRPQPWQLRHDHPLYRPQPLPPRPQAPQQQEQRPPPPQQQERRPPPPQHSWPWLIPNAVEIYQQLPQHRHIHKLLQPPNPRPHPPQRKRSMQPPQLPRLQPQPQPVEPINPHLPQAHTLRQQFLHQTQRQSHLRDQQLHLLASVHQHSPNVPLRSPNHRRQLGHALTCDEKYAEKEFCERRCYCTPGGKIACDTVKTRMEMEAVFSDPANEQFDKVTDKRKEKLKQMHVRQVEMGCGEECLCMVDGNKPRRTGGGGSEVKGDGGKRRGEGRGRLM